MLVLVASEHDLVARQAVARWASLDAALLSPRDLSRPGWTYAPDDCGRGYAVVGGRRVAMSRITSVVTRLPCVVVEVLGHIARDDREYAAAEMTAFLLAWLSDRELPVVNRPTATCLAGPHRRPEQWVHTAGQLGIPVQRWHLRAPRLAPCANEPVCPPPTFACVTIVGACCLGTEDAVSRAHARRLAEAVGAMLLNVYFTGHGRDALLVGADVWPDLSDPRIADALRPFLTARRQ